MWVSGAENRTRKGPEVGVDLACSRSRQETRWQLAQDQRGTELGTRWMDPVVLPGHCRSLDTINLREKGSHWRVLEP